jgi:CRISPR/Cas system endoribonuclease Cas6 (RAMP superfamily)
MNLDPSDKNYDSHLQDTVNILHPDYNPNTKMYDFIYQGTRFVRIVSPNPNFISDFYTLSANLPSIELSGFEITINRATNVEVHGDLEKFNIGQLSEPILVSE